MSAFSTDDTDGLFILGIDVQQLQRSDAARLDVGPGVLRLKLLYAEAEALWRELDTSIGNHVRERDGVVRSMQAFRERYGDVSVPSPEEYRLAMETMSSEKIDLDEPRFLEAAEVVRRYQFAFGE